MSRSKIKIDDSIKNYVESFFTNVYYSDEVFRVKEKILKKVNDDYNKELENNKKNAFEVIVNKYNTLEAMVNSISYDSSRIEKWFSKNVTTTYDDFIINFNKEKKYIYLVSVHRHYH